MPLHVKTGGGGIKATGARDGGGTERSAARDCPESIPTTKARNRPLHRRSFLQHTLKLRIPQLAHERCALSATFPKKATSVNPSIGFPMKRRSLCPLANINDL